MDQDGALTPNDVKSPGELKGGTSSFIDSADGTEDGNSCSDCGGTVDDKGAPIYGGGGGLTM